VIKSNQKKYKTLRDEFPVFTFEKYYYYDREDALEVVFHFNIGEKLSFKSSLAVQKSPVLRHTLPNAIIDTLIFNIGMIELLSYWKLTCSPKILIKPFRLTQEQIHFWKKIYFMGLGEFFFTNGIENEQDSFVNLECTSDRVASRFTLFTDPEMVSVPVGGGKDSSVTLEILRKHRVVIPFILNPGKAATETTRIAGYSDKQVILGQRTLDKKLLELNEQGFLNGHTPFSALLGFITLLTAACSGSKYIALSNESSANEPTTASGVNHQYSKSYEYEKDFRRYVAEYMTSDIDYFSFLRPLNEYGIARLFSGFPQYFDAFRSCNVGSKSGSWCGTCSKCLFTYIILSPFIEQTKLAQIFGKDLFEDASLIPLLRELTGTESTKPFECVGTTDEVVTALYDIVNKRQGDLPAFLSYFIKEIAPLKPPLSGSGSIGNSFDNNHFLDESFLKILKTAIHG
jgi:UDP-N-acetyl-alpha-D-muramoyl-L-alanyl-L-glutamate epimerase